MIDDTQVMWPFGPAPSSVCGGDGSHDWVVEDMAGVYEPPLPTVRCVRCDWRWTRRMTLDELKAFAKRGGEASEKYYALGYKGWTDPTYADGSAVEQVIGWSKKP